MDRIVCIMRSRNQKFRIQQEIAFLLDILKRYWIHVVNEDSPVNLITFDTEIAAIVSENYFVSNVLPLLGSVEYLIKISIEPKGILSNRSTQSQISVALLEGIEFG